eukprot:Nitzschia sp. Nitz4//scaffold133_size116822//16384//18375//NITZ4_003793-RA/size116822-processed-gene-0.22-mRNA-1//1//CDS//3329535354//5447//frame0
MLSSLRLISSPSRKSLVASFRSFSGSRSAFAAYSQVKVQTQGLEFGVSIQESSESTETVLCLPGALGTGPSDFPQLLEGGLGPQFRVVAFDPRGLGGSANVERDFPLDFYQQDAKDAAAVMKELGYDKYHVMGWSDGANSAVHLAAHPQTRKAVQSMVIWGGNSYVTQEDCDAWETLRSIDNWSERMRNDKAAIHGGLERLQELNEKATDAWIRYYTDPVMAGDVCLKALHEVLCPTLVIHGAKDVVCPTKHARYIARQIANAELVLFAEGKHNLHQRFADTFHETASSFMLQQSEDSPVVPDATKDDEEPVVDEIAYAFMGSQALFSAIRAKVFDAIHEATTEIGAPFSEVERLSEVKGERLKTLLTALVSLKLLRRDIIDGVDYFTLKKATAAELVRSSRYYWGDYISEQVGGQFYTRMTNLDETMRTGTAASDGYEAWFEEDPEAAKQYTQAQHNGSLATAHALHKRLPFLAEEFPNMKMLDVGGGSGAFSIATARKISGAECVVLDLPNVTKVADEIIEEEPDDVKSRLSTLSLSATAPGEWQNLIDDEAFDAVLMSYVSGSIPTDALPGLYKNAFRVLKPGGVAIIHDFMVDNDGEGPQNAALWALAHVSANPEGMGLQPKRLVDLLAEEGFVAPKVDDLIKGATQLIVARKPALATV